MLPVLRFDGYNDVTFADGSLMLNPPLIFSVDNASYLLHLPNFTFGDNLLLMAIIAVRSLGDYFVNVGVNV